MCSGSKLVKMKDLSYYTNIGIEWPELPSRPKLLKDASPKQIREYAEEKEKYAGDKKRYDLQVEDYRKKEAELIEQFKDDLMADNGVTGHPKAQKVWDKAWQMGHSSGLHDVRIYFNEMVELIK